jgi:trk system potassium uptake protein TrkH
MFLFGISFTLYFCLLGRKIKNFIKDEELKIYFEIVVATILIITINISGLYSGILESFRYSSFHVLSIISTTGFTTVDFNLWPTLSQIVVLFLMVVGCCADSTGGGMKLMRVLILLKAAIIEIVKIFHPESVKAVSINGKK